jgi:hypothetical protein
MAFKVWRATQALSFNHTDSTSVNKAMCLAFQVVGVVIIFVQGPFNDIERIII